MTTRALLRVVHMVSPRGVGIDGASVQVSVSGSYTSTLSSVAV